MIPKIIHQTWKTNNLPNDFKLWSNTWKILNPDYIYKFYDDDDCLLFINNNYPEFINLYNNLIPIQKSDVFRYLILHKYGGFYADMDTICYRSIEQLRCRYSTKLITGIEYNGNEKGIDYKQYQQWFIGSPSGHEMLYNIVKEIEYRWYYLLWFYKFLKGENKLTYWLTGPELYTEVINNNDIKDVVILKKGLLGSYDKSKITKYSYLDHMFKGTWKK